MDDEVRLMKPVYQTVLTFDLLLLITSQCCLRSCSSDSGRSECVPDHHILGRGMFALRNCLEGLDWRLLTGPNSVDPFQRSVRERPRT
jgi:hypothetical protein